MSLYSLSLFDRPLLMLIRLAELGSHAFIEAMLVDVSSLPNPWALGSPGATDINPGADLWFSLPVGLRPDAYSASAPPANGWPAWSPRQQQQLHGGEPLSVGGGKDTWPVFLTLNCY